MAFFQIIASDIDGTLTSGGEMSSVAVDAIDRVRRAGVVVVFVTGRIEAELAAAFPHIADHADALVLENGAVAVLDGQSRPLATPVDDALDGELAERGIPFRRGRVLVATDAEHATAVVEVIGRLGLDCQMIRNRGAAMVLPAGVTKGTGLDAVLAHLHRSPHNAIALGDAENDLSMFAAAEVGLAVPNAVPSVRAHADDVLEGPNGSGVANLLAGPLLSGARRWCPPRRWVDIGVFDDGTPTKIPGSQGRIVVSGPPGSGKSHLIGLMAERWILSGYSTLVVDPEGDHTSLRELDGVHVIDSRRYLPEPSVLVDILHPGTSLVVDLSANDQSDTRAYVHRLRRTVEAHRERHGFPHWAIYDEAHLLGPQEEPHWIRRGGYVLSSFAPAALPADELEDSDVIVRMAYPDAGSHGLLGSAHRATIRFGEDQERPFTVGDRHTSHIRHRHKYADNALPEERRFYFHGTVNQSLSPAATMRDFHAAVGKLDAAALQYHLERGDFSRWLAHTVADRELAAEVAALEDRLAAQRAADIERVRNDIVRSVNDRYLAAGPECDGPSGNSPE